MAYTLLGLISRQNFGDRDYPAWEAWAAEARKAPLAEKKKSSIMDVFLK